MKRIFAAILIITVVISLGVVITFGEETTRGKNYYDSKSASKMEKTLYNVSKGLKKVKKKEGCYFPPLINQMSNFKSMLFVLSSTAMSCSSFSSLLVLSAPLRAYTPWLVT